MVLDTLAAPDPKILVGPRGLRQKGIDEGGLADPGLPGGEHHLALPRKRPLQGSRAVAPAPRACLRIGGEVEGGEQRSTR